MGRRKNYPYNKKIDKQMGNLVSGMLTGVILSPSLLFSSSKEGNSEGGWFMVVIMVLLSPFIILTPFVWDGLSCLSFILKLVILLFVYVLIGTLEFYLVYKILKFADILSDRYDYLIFRIARKSNKSRYSEIRKDYFKTIRKNNRANPKVIELHNKIKHYQSLLDNNLNTDKESKYREIIESSHQELIEIKKNIFNAFRTDYKEPIIRLEPSDRETTLPDFEGLVYLNIDKKISFKRTINFEEIVPLNNDGKQFFTTNIKPLKSLISGSIEFLFYDRYLLLMTKNDFTIIEYKDIIGTYLKNSIEISSSSFGNTKMMIPKYFDNLPELRKDNSKEYAMIDVGILQLNIFSKKIHLLFTKYNEGKLINDLISNTKD